MSAIIECQCTHYTSSGGRYRVYHDGEVLLKSCRDPLHDAARALVDKGVTGRLQMKHVGSPMIEMEGLIAVLATLTVVEGQSTSARLGKWAPHWAQKEAV